MKTPIIKKEDAVQKLLEVMTQLRNPDGGCPWDLEQSYKSIARYTLEEVYEVIDAIENEDMDALKDELGDLLFQVVFYAQIAKEEGHFDFEDVCAQVAKKMITRHPHVFGDDNASEANDVENDKDGIWEKQKDLEKKRTQAQSVLDDVPMALPALKRAQKLQKRAARVGFEWDEAIDVLDKLEEEAQEMREAIKGGKKEEVLDELGDLYFVLTNFSRMLGQDAEYALLQANRKFERRFRGMELSAKMQGLSMNDMSLEELEELWLEQKASEKAA